MFSEKQKAEITRRLSEIPNLGHREEGQRIKLQEMFDQICGMEETDERTEMEKQFQNQLLDLENYVSYLKGRMKI